MDQGVHVQHYFEWTTAAWFLCISAALIKKNILTLLFCFLLSFSSFCNFRRDLRLYLWYHRVLGGRTWKNKIVIKKLKELFFIFSQTTLKPYMKRARNQAKTIVYRRIGTWIWNRCHNVNAVKAVKMRTILIEWLDNVGGRI